MNIKFKSICKIDKTGRIVIPIALRKLLKISADDELNITVTEEGIVLNKA